MQTAPAAARAMTASPETRLRCNRGANQPTEPPSSTGPSPTLTTWGSQGAHSIRCRCFDGRERPGKHGRLPSRRRRQSPDPLRWSPPHTYLWCWIREARRYPGAGVAFQVDSSLWNSDPDGLGQTSLAVTTGWEWNSGTPPSSTVSTGWLRGFHFIAVGPPLFRQQPTKPFVCIPLYAVDDLSTTHMACS